MRGETNDAETRGRGDAEKACGITSPRLRVSASPRRWWTWLLIVLVVAAALRTACFLAAPESMIFPPDSAGYLDTARGLLEHGRFGNDVPDVNRTPGYPLFCSLGLAIGGWQAIIGLQIFLDCLTTAGVVFLGRSLAGPRAGLVAAGVYAVAPLPIVLSCQVLTETLFLAVLVPSLWLAVTLLRGAGILPARLEGVPPSQPCQATHPAYTTSALPPLRSAAGTGAVLALAVLSAVLLYIRPSAMVFVAAVFIAWLWRAATCWRRNVARASRPRVSRASCPRSGDEAALPSSSDQPHGTHNAGGTPASREGLRWLVWAGVYLAVVVAAVLPWCVRNERAAGYFGLSGQGPITYARDWAGLVLARARGVPLDEARTEIWHKVLHSSGVADGIVADEILPPFDPAAMVHHRMYSAMQAEAKFVLPLHAGLFVREHVSQSFLALPPPAEALHLIGANLGEKGTRTVLSQQGVWAAIRYYFTDHTATFRVDAMIVYALLALVTLALYALAVRGLWRRVRQMRNRNKQPAESVTRSAARAPTRSAVTVLLGFFAIAHFFAGGIATVPRYFLPLLPLVAVLSAIGAQKMATKDTESTESSGTVPK